MKKICFITTVSSTIKSFILNTAEYLYENGQYDITFICNYDEELIKCIPSYIHYMPIKMKRGVSLDGIKAIIKFYKIFKKEKFDLIQYSTPNAALYASIAGRLAKVKVRLYCQWGIRYVGFKGIKRQLFKVLEKKVCNNSTWIEPDSFGNLKFSHDENLYTDSNSSVIWNGSANGIDLKRFDINKKQIWNNEIRKKYNLNNNIIIGFIGRLEKDKGINELFEAFRNLNYNNVKLMIVGAEDKRETINGQLYKWAKSCKNIIFTGKVSDVEKYYSTFDIFVLPSYREGFGTVVIEAEAMGVPVIVTNIPGSTDAMIKNETGLIVNKGDSISLQLAIEKLIKNQEMRDEMSENAVKFAREKFENKKLFEFIFKDRERLLKLEN